MSTNAENVGRKRILVFLSMMHDNGKTYKYSCPDGTSVRGGSLSSEAPIRYLIKHDSEIEDVICIVTDVAANSYNFVSSFLKESGISTTPIRFEQGMDFEKDVLPKVIDTISPSDEIYLETTGGFRDAVIKLNLIANILRYRGIKVAGAVYSSLPETTITDVSSFMSPDLINGLSEFSRFCSVSSLKAHFNDNSELAPLLNAMGKLSESIALCQTDRIDKDISTINTELGKLRHSCDTQTNLLLDIFGEKFSHLRTIPDIVEWCLENNFIQQAVTIFNERMPEFIIKETFLIDVKNTQLGSTPDCYKAFKDLFSLGSRYPEIIEESNSAQAQLRKIVQAHKFELLTSSFNNPTDNGLSSEVRKGIEVIRVIIRSMFEGSPYKPEYAECDCKNNCKRYRAESAVDARCKGCVNDLGSWTQEALRSTNTEKVLRNAINKLIWDTTGHERRNKASAVKEVETTSVNRFRDVKRPIDIINCIVRLSSDELGILMGLSTARATDYDINEQYYYTLISLESILNTSAYSSCCPVDLRQVLMDYLYARIIRNRVCHTDLERHRYGVKGERYLKEHSRLPSKNLDIAEIKRTLSTSLELIRKYQYNA